MKKFFWLGLFLNISIFGVTIWNGNVVTDVCNDDINITGNVTLGTPGVINHITVAATTGNHVITMTGGPFSISPNDNAVACTGAVALHFVVATGFSITVNVTENLFFSGNNQPLLISLQGGGSLIFNITPGKQVQFGNTFLPGPTTGAGTYMMVALSGANPSHLVFQRSANNNLDSTVKVGPNSIMSFMGTDTTFATETGFIDFNATNSLLSTGHLILNILPAAGVNQVGGSVAIQSYNTNLVTPVCGIAVPNFSYCDIDFTALAGHRGTLRTLISGGGVWSGVQILNQNTTMPDYRYNPWFLGYEEGACTDREVSVGIQPGFILGANGLLIVSDQSYFDYIGGTTNISPNPNIPEVILDYLSEVNHMNCVLPQTFQVVKDRNPSAFIVDSVLDPCDPLNDQFPQIDMQGTSKMYFRSAVNCEGFSSGMTVNNIFYPYIVDPDDQFTSSQGYGSIVFDVEGQLQVVGVSSGDKAINILSLYEQDTGGSVFIEGTETNFKLRPVDANNMWLRDANGIPLQYGKAAFLINGRMNLIGNSVTGADGIALQHTDEIHRVFEKNALQQSEATYIGGETFRFCNGLDRPKIAFYDSFLFLHSSVAFTGVDLFTPSYGTTAGSDAQDNFSNFVFYQNGFCVDQGTGRSLILGTNVGALASDLATIVDNAAHFDVFQEFPQPVPPVTATNIVATLLTRPNNNKVIERTPSNQNLIASQYSVHSFYVANATNVSVGTAKIPGVAAGFGVDPCTGNTFTLTANPTLFVNGSFIAFESQGGILNSPPASIEIGQGGIFIDQNGLFELANNQRMSLATMVGLGFNGAIDVKERQVYIQDEIGITRSNLDMSDASQRVIIPSMTNIPEFVLDWKFTIKDTCGASGSTATPNYIPYTAPAVPAACQCPAVIPQNISSIPSVEGKVTQFQIVNSRLGDPATLLVDGGTIKELLYEGTSPASGVAPVGILVLQNNAFVGLGSSSRASDSPQANMVLGENGVTLIANGNAQVLLNENVIINNVCHFVVGPDFGETAPQQLYITSEVPREIRVKNGGFLDLSQFSTNNMNLIIGGKVRLIFEPGSGMFLGGGKLTITDNASLFFEPFINPNFVGVDITSSNLFRVRIGGTGTMLFEEDASIQIPRDACVGIESIGTVTIPDAIPIPPGDQDPSDVTIVDCSVITNLTWTFEDAGNLLIGSDTDFGGTLQIGNTSNVQGGSVSFTIIINGPDTLVNVNSQGLLGLAVGQVNKPAGAPNTWLVAPLNNVQSITINNIQGTFRSNNILLGSHEDAGLIAIGPVTTGYTFTLDPNSAQARVLGGGNLVLIGSGTPATGIAPTVLTVDGFINNNLLASILASRPTLDDPSKTPPAAPATAAELFAYLKANPFENQVIKRAQAAENSLGTITIGYVTGTTIHRTDVTTGVRSPRGDLVNPARSLEFGALGLALTSDGTPTTYSIRP
jgi:hypothetical protein